MTDCGPFMQAGADDYARAMVSAATEPLAVQIATLTNQLNAAKATLATSVAAVAERDRTIADLQQQIAVLKAPPPGPIPTGPALPAGWSKVTFFDDFTGPLNLDVWKVEDGYGYKRDQAWLSKGQVTVKNSCLVITAATLPTPISGRTVTSGAVSTKGPKPVRQRGGRIEICAALPTFDAAWSAGWGRNDPAAGEIDIFEAVGLRSPIVQTAHQDTSGLLDHLGYDWVPPLGWNRADFHTYATEWDADTGHIRWYVDTTMTHEATPDTIGYPSKTAAAWLTGAAYSQPMALLLNLQVGGGMSAYYGKQVLNPAQLDGGPGSQLRVDWVRFLTR